MYIDVFEEYETKNTLLNSNAYYQIFASEEIVFDPGFEYDPNSPKYLEAEIKDCPSVKENSIGDNSLVNNQGEPDFKTSGISEPKGNMEINNPIKGDGIRIYPNPSNDGNFWCFQLIAA